LSASGIPTISVVIPTYNYAGYLGRAIESVLGQTFDDFELLVLDDASTDDTESLVASYESEPRFRFRRNERNVGLFANFNAGAAWASGKYLKFVCADDWLDPRFLERTASALESQPDAVLATTANYLADEKGQLTGRQYAPFGASRTVSPGEATVAMADWLNVVGMPTNVLMRRDAFVEVGGFDARFAPAADIHLYLKLFQHGGVAWIDEPLAYARIHDVHTHSYGPDPTESTFLAWEDAARWESDLVTPSVLRRALYAEARRSLLYVGAHALRGRIGRARELAATASRHVDWWRVLPRFLLDLPGIAFDQGSRIYALRTGRLVDYNPRPRVGPARDTVTG
jgi:glycosyltransferase involved in cell wall biosynthesis